MRVLLPDHALLDVFPLGLIRGMYRDQGDTAVAAIVGEGEHRYSPDGTLLYSWGESGTFDIVHNITRDGDGGV